MKVKVAGGDVIDTDAPDIYAEIRASSITPTTFEFREFASSISDTTFVERYYSGSSTVLRFGINPKVVPTDPDLYGSAASISSPAHMISIKGPGSVKSSSTNKSEVDIANQVKHHFVEISAFQQATNHLLSSSDRTVIFDILTRNKSDIKEPLEVHAVLLYKNPVDPMTGKHDLIVIDPSNFTYSSHLSTKNTDIASKVTHTHLSAIKTFHKQIQIYKAEGPIGPAPNQYRDCIDVAVKLAFGFNSTPEHDIDVKKTNMHPVVIAIANTGIDSCFLSVDAAVRVKQSSDFNVVSTFKSIEDSVYKKMDILNNIARHVKDRIGIYDVVLTKASDLDDSCKDTVVDAIHDRKVAKTPKIDNYKSIVQAFEALQLRHIDILQSDNACFAELCKFDVELNGQIPLVLDKLDI